MIAPDPDPRQQVRFPYRGECKRCRGWARLDMPPPYGICHTCTEAPPPDGEGEDAAESPPGPPADSVILLFAAACIGAFLFILWAKATLIP